MKTALVISAIVLTVIFFSCKDNSVSTTNTAAFQLSGTIDNWTYGNMKMIAEVFDSLYVHSEALDSCIIGTDGSFALNLKTPTQSMLYGFSSSVFYGCTGSIFVNPSNAKHTILLVSVYDSTRHQFGVVNKRNYDSTLINGSYYLDYFYCDKSVTLVGNQVCVSGGDTTVAFSDWFGDTGWNKAVNLYNRGGHTYKYSLINTEPTGGTWRFQRTQSDLKEVRDF